MRNRIVGSSWKMHIDSLSEGQSLVEGLKELLTDYTDKVDLFFLPNYLLLPMVKKVLSETEIKYGVQNIASIEKGAMTGEVPVNIVSELGCTYVELGHAERRAHLGETNETVAAKVKLCEQHNLYPIICIGETKEELKAGIGDLVLKTQIEWAIKFASEDFRENIILAYEPVWAIGQSDSADKEYVIKTHRYIRDCIKELFGESLAEKIRIIYGGSVNPKSAKELSGQEDIDGLFVGRFGMKPQGMTDIVKAFIGE